MAIEVLKRGTIPELEQTFECACSHCKSKLKFTSADARREYHASHGQRDPEYYTYHINCPVCRAALFVSSEK